MRVGVLRCPDVKKRPDLGNRDFRHIFASRVVQMLAGRFYHSAMQATASDKETTEDANRTRFDLELDVFSGSFDRLSLIRFFEEARVR